MRDPGERLRDIIDAIDRIQIYSVQGKSAFEGDDRLQVWMVHHLQIIGEAASRLSRDYQDAHPQVPWAQIVAMRNVLVHDYFGVDTHEVRNVIEQELPALKLAVVDIMANG